ncbi:unnamed protein product [Rhizophagus irregularis]|nr:unnamed protein product [Rhizophagus irregularis]CAB4432365.1 unnamed protein product [Rhizophagus irregularis]
MRCFSSVFVRHSTPSIPYAIPFYIRPSIPLSVSPITCIERSKQGVTFNKELFALIGGVFVQRKKDKKVKQRNSGKVERTERSK